MTRARILPLRRGLAAVAEPREPLDAQVEPERAAVLVAYLLHLAGSAGALAGLLALSLPNVVALVMNYVKRSGAGSLLESHHAWMIRTFWWALPWAVLGLLTTGFVVGWLILGLAWLWYVYRHVLGLIRLANGERMPR